MAATPLGAQRAFAGASGRRNAPQPVARTASIARVGVADLLRPVIGLGTKASTLNEGIASFYDESSGLWEDIWGEHMHHGLYRPGETISDREAQERMIDESLRWAGVTSVTSMVDVGCGVGGSSRYIARKFGCTAQSVTLSPYQAGRANELSRVQGLSDRCTFSVADALAMPFPDAKFDLVWSMESGEHMPDKAKFVGELCRVCAPGGRVLIVTWCHRELMPGESLRPEEQNLLDRICEAYYLPAWCSAQDYSKLLRERGFQDVRVDDWSDLVAPFWGRVIRSALTGRGMAGLLKAGWTTLKGALVMPLMAEGFRMGTIKFNLITGKKSN